MGTEALYSRKGYIHVKTRPALFEGENTRISITSALGRRHLVLLDSSMLFFMGYEAGDGIPEHIPEGATPTLPSKQIIAHTFGPFGSLSYLCIRLDKCCSLR